MKALLVETNDGKTSAIVLLPSGKIELNVGDIANVVISLERDSFRVRFLSASDFSSFRVIREVKINSRLLGKAFQYSNALIEYERQKAELKNDLLNQMVEGNCDALTFLDLGSVAL